jgi:hypothetical protein
MSESDSPRAEHDPSAELGLKNPVRDQERLGDRKYSVTPPRSKVRAPAQAESGKASCHSCRAELDPTESYRVDADEYVYHFCGTECFQRWHRLEEPPGSQPP